MKEGGQPGVELLAFVEAGGELLLAAHPFVKFKFAELAKDEGGREAHDLGDEQGDHQRLFGELEVHPVLRRHADDGVHTVDVKPVCT